MFFSTRRRVAALALGVVVGLSGLGPMAFAHRDGDDDDGNGNGGDTTEQDFEFDFDFDVDAINVELGDITVTDLFDAITLNALMGPITVLNGSPILSGNTFLNGNNVLGGGVLNGDILNGNTVPVLSGNTIPILSGNTIGDVLSPALLNCVGGPGAGPDCNLLSGNTLGDVIGGDVLPVTVGDVLGGGVLSGNEDVLSPTLLNCVAFGAGPDCNLLSGIGIGDVLSPAGDVIGGDVIGGDVIGGDVLPVTVGGLAAAIGDVLSGNSDVLSDNSIVDVFVSICSSFDADGPGADPGDESVDCIIPVLVGLFGNDVLGGDDLVDVTTALIEGDVLSGNALFTLIGILAGNDLTTGDVLTDLVNAGVDAGLGTGDVLSNFIVSVCSSFDEDGPGADPGDESVDCIIPVLVGLFDSGVVNGPLADNLTVLLIAGILNDLVDTGDITAPVTLTVDTINVLTEAAATAVVAALDNDVSDVLDTGNLVDVAVDAIVAAIVNDVTFVDPLVDASGALAGNTVEDVADVTVDVSDTLVDVSGGLVDASGGLVDTAVEIGPNFARDAVSIGNNFARNLIDASRTRIGPMNNLARDVLEDVDVTIDAIIRDVLNGSVF